MASWIHPEPAPPAFGGQEVVPERSASLLSKLTIYWLSPLLKVGFTRPLQFEDLWQLPSNLLAAPITKHFEAELYSRYPPEERPATLRHLSSDSAKHDRSLMRAIHAGYWRRIYLAGFMRFIAALTPTLSSFVTRALLNWLTTSHNWYNASDVDRQQMTQPAGVGYGIGLAFTLFIMQEVASLAQNHYVIITTVSGVIIRTALVDLLFRKSLRLSNKARLEYSVGRFTTMISVDCTALETSLVYFHNVWVGPIVILVAVGLLINNLGYSALVGFCVLLLGIPIQTLLMKFMYRQRMSGIAITDQRVQLTNEILQGIRLIKYYAWESFYSHRVGTYRSQELAALRNSALAASASAAILAFIPVLAAVLTFVTYVYTGHTLQVSTVFSSLQLFATIRSPLNMLMYVLRAMLGGHVAMKRINTYFNAEDAEDGYTLNITIKDAISVDASFTWEANFDAAVKLDDTEVDQIKEPNPVSVGSLPLSRSDAVVEPVEHITPGPFVLNNIEMEIPRGAFVAIVGRIGSGKSSLMQGMIGEMRRTRGHVAFGGDVAYVPQTPWIMNASIRDNILFGLPGDDDKLRDVVRACSLSRDLDMLSHGAETEIGERGIGLSGGQKARVALARAAYADAEVILLDDPLSAVDAHTSKDLVQNCFLSGPMARKTRILITHALHVLDKVDYVYVMNNGKIAEHGTCSDLRRTGSMLPQLIQEYGSQERQDADETPVQSNKKNASVKAPELAADAEPDNSDNSKVGLMQAEERQTGGISWRTYIDYLRYGGGSVWAVYILVLLLLSQGASVGSNLFLGFWTSQSIRGFSQDDYMAVYSGLGVAQAVTTFAVSLAFCFLGLSAGSAIFNAAFRAVIRAPTNWFDTVPLGRIMSRLSQDQGTMDQDLPINQFELLTSVMTVFGTIALVFYTIPILGIIFAPLGLLYYVQTTYYRRSMMETRRLDSVIRSGLYTTITETLTGLSSVRAYRQESQFLDKAQSRIDMQNRPKYIIIFIQRWLSMRLDMCGNILLLAIGIYTAVRRYSVDPAKIGVILSYSITITQTLNETVQLYGTTEANMNSVERMLHYTELPREEGSTVKSSTTPSWPSDGAIRFDHVDYAYREGLPLVLKDLSFTVAPRQKVAIVGRTGAGKSSLLQALFRITETRRGAITIDGVDIRSIGLSDLRHRLSLVPQESVLFYGSLRENLDPQGSKTDAELILALQQAHLLPPSGSSVPADRKFELEAVIREGGENYSSGEKQAIALARALVKNSRVVVLDEATSSVDAETDAKMQRTMQTEFASSTVLCIAHRLNTIAWYDKVLVLDAGRLVEHGSPLDLFDAGGVFWSLCDEASVSREDIMRIRAAVSSSQ